MERYMCSILGVLVLVLAACGPNQPDPTAQAITYRLAQEGAHFSDTANVYLPKNCFDLHESITIRLTLQAGTLNLHLAQLSFIVKGPLYTDAPQRFVWTPPTATVLRASDPAQQYDWTLPDLEPGMYILVIGSGNSEEPTRMLFGVTYLQNFYDVNIPCDQLETE
ncbi:hypothetical protein [Herpetosiphon gulosus]|uniref:Intracellular proteinase inhibitor BsuPI domain-containing protein n=1 Tax=Herpetosiphon gulosus TaxID=1973496 RepID=A0ABP9WYH7_9CHLR